MRLAVAFQLVVEIFRYILKFLKQSKSMEEKDNKLSDCAGEIRNSVLEKYKTIVDNIRFE